MTRKLRTVTRLQPSIMRSSFLLAGNLFVILGAATPVELQQRDDECVQDQLYNCFSSSLVQASQFCTDSIVTATGFTEVVTVTPTLTITNTVTETATITQSPPLRARRGKRGCSHRPPLNCLRSFASSVEAFQFTSACACIGIRSTTDVATVTADVTNTIVETPTVTEYVTVSPTSLVEESTQEPTSEPTTITSTPEVPLTASVEKFTPEPTTTSAPGTSTTISAEESTREPTTTPVPESTTTTAAVPESTTSSAPAPLVTNGDFDRNSLEGWAVSAMPAGGSIVSTRNLSGRGYVLDIYTSYFLRSTTATATVVQTIQCEPGASYRLIFLLSLVSSYTNGNPWSVKLGSTTVASGAGSSVAWNQFSHTFACSSAESGNDLVFKLQSNTAREARLLVDDVIVVKT
ncbi:hypothetical protein QBC36DRAFT_391226 [Triangularia setosa]|uniref:CBM-cenC domain-containing protein n=1 Tax=Triangularia setosa TaxID=2587417 RepID=A0AAN6VWU4_9PEZI|nr:hypothetical protein QBC36DRAFT_391226 [Podospora setosa]